MKTHKDYLKKLIQEGKTDAALKAFLNGAEASKQEELYDNIILLMARNSNNEKNHIGFLIDSTTYERGKAQINYAIISLLEDYKPTLPYPKEEEENLSNERNPQNKGGVNNSNNVIGNGNIIIDGISGSSIHIGGGANPPITQNFNTPPPILDATLKQNAISHIELGEFVEAFELLDGVEVGTKKMQYNRFKDEYMAGLSGMAMIDFSKRLKFFVNQLK